jgi:diaminopimelate epimerase
VSEVSRVWNPLRQSLYRLYKKLNDLKLSDFDILHVMKYSKYDALGNVYIVLNPADVKDEPSTDLIIQLCAKAKSDGLLFGPLTSKKADFKLRIFNPDGSEAEKSGNGLRIFSKYLYDNNLTSKNEFTIETLGGVVRSKILNADLIEVEMGKVSFWSNEIPVLGERREVLKEKLNIEDKTFTFSAATVGNPHCVIILPEVSEDLAKRYGFLIENNSIFPNRINVQFVKILDRNNIQMFIWERGAGYTQASGSSSCAASAVVHKLGLCDSNITVHMPGGELKIKINPDFSIIMTGPVKKI